MFTPFSSLIHQQMRIYDNFEVNYKIIDCKAKCIKTKILSKFIFLILFIFIFYYHSTSACDRYAMLPNNKEEKSTEKSTSAANAKSAAIKRILFRLFMAIKKIS
jgi:hypothetical protein